MKYTKLCLTGLTGFLLGSSAYYGVDTLITEEPIQEHSSAYVEESKEKEVEVVEVIKEVPVVEYVKADNGKMGALYMAMAYRRTGMDDTTIRQTLLFEDKFNQNDIKWAFSQLH